MCGHSYRSVPFTNKETKTGAMTVPFTNEETKTGAQMTGEITEAKLNFVDIFSHQ